MTQLYRLGVINWQQGSYDSITWSQQEQQFDLNGTKAHGLIAANALTAAADSLSTHVLAQTREPARGDPVYNKGRFPRHKTGKLMHLVEYVYFPSVLFLTGHIWEHTGASIIPECSL